MLLAQGWEFWGGICVMSLPEEQGGVKEQAGAASSFYWALLAPFLLGMGGIKLMLCGSEFHS